MKKVNIDNSFIKVMTGSDLSTRRLAYTKLKSGKEGPVLWFAAGVHGDEVGGIVIVQEVFKRLRREGLLKGEVHALPLMNPIGFESGARGTVVSEEDLNRVFPGNKNGTFAERLADTIFSQIIKTKPTLVLDLHNDWSNSIPYTLIDPSPGQKHKDAYEKVKLYSQQTGFLIINEEEVNTGEKDELEKSLSGSLLLHDIPALTLEVGGAYVVNEADVALGVRSIFNMLSFLGMINPLPKKFMYNIPISLSNKILRYTHKPLCSKSGIIRFVVKPGEIVKTGQPLAKVYNVLGKLQETLLSPYESIILGHSDSSVALPGMPAIMAGIINK